MIFESGIDFISQVEKVHAQKRARTYEQINRICKEEIRSHVHNEDKLTHQFSASGQSPNLDSANFFFKSSYLEFLDQSVILRSDDFLKVLLILHDTEAVLWLKHSSSLRLP